MRKVFFSFHYQRDSWRVSQVRNAWFLGPNRSAQPFLDKAKWEEVERGGNSAIQNWIDRALSGTSVTIVLIGAETYLRDWVNYEIKKSHQEGKGLIGIKIHNLKNQNQNSDVAGFNPFDNFYIESNGIRTNLSGIYPTYDWILDNGRQNIGSWVEKAAVRAGYPSSASLA